jgi:uncharacterized protein (TIGR02001 family)
MKKWIGAAFAAGAALTMGTAYADAPKLTFTGNVALTSNYTFRGLSQTTDNPAVQGGFDAAYGDFYAGVWASSLDFSDSFGPNSPLETDLYGGWKHAWGETGITTDVGVIGYLYPGAKDGSKYGFGENDYLEVYLKGGYTIPGTKLGVGANFYYSPDFFGHADGGIGSAYYIEGAASYPITDALSVSGAYGYQQIDGSGFLLDGLTGPASDHYTNWNFGVTYAAWGFTFDARYIDTDIEAVTYPADDAKSRGVFTIKRTF